MKDTLLIISTIIEILLFVVFITTGISKIKNPGKYVAYIYKDFLFLKKFSTKHFIYLTVFLGLLEFFLGILTFFSEVSAYAFLIVLFVYILYLFQKDPESSCNCGGILDYFLTNKYQSIIRNSLLMSGCLLILFVNRPHEFVYDLLILCLGTSTLFFIIAYFNIINLKRKGDTNDA